MSLAFNGLRKKYFDAETNHSQLSKWLFILDRGLRHLVIHDPKVKDTTQKEAGVCQWSVADCQTKPELVPP